MKEQEVFHHTGFPETELQYGLISATGLTGAAFLLIQDVIGIPDGWLPALITIIILTIIITWLFKQISNRERIVLDEIGITMVPKFGKPQNYDWEQVSHLGLKKPLLLESRIYLTDGSYITSNVVRFPPVEVVRRSRLLSSIMDNELEIINYNALEGIPFGKALLSFAPQIMSETEARSEAKKREVG